MASDSIRKENVNLLRCSSFQFPKYYVIENKSISECNKKHRSAIFRKVNSKTTAANKFARELSIRIQQEGARLLTSI